MKVQEVMLRAWARKITWWQAAESLGISDWHLRRIREAYEKFGYFGLLDRRRGQPSNALEDVQSGVVHSDTPTRDAMNGKQKYCP